MVRMVKAGIYTTHEQEDPGDLISTLSEPLTQQSVLEKTRDEFYEDQTIWCNPSFSTKLGPKKATSNSSVPWWPDDLTIMRQN